MFKTKDDFIKALRKDPQYRRALKMAKDDNQRRHIIANIEGFVTSFANVLAPVIEKASTDKNFASELREALKRKSDVITEEGEQASSGSLG